MTFGLADLCSFSWEALFFLVLLVRSKKGKPLGVLLKYPDFENEVLK